MYKLNALNSPEDKRDWNAETFCNSEVLPPIVDYRKKLLPIRDQGNQGACVAFSGACIKELQELKEDKLKHYFSPQFIYDLRPNYPNQGMAPRDLMNILKDFGCPIEDDYYYENGNTKSLRKNKKIIDYARNFKIAGYARVNDLQTLKESIFKNGVCTISVIIYNVNNSTPWKQINNQTSQGSHQMAIVGYNDIDQYLIIRNSWGDAWGDKGYCYMPYKDFDTYKLECWTAIDADSKKNGRYVYTGQWYKKPWYKIKWFWYKYKYALKFYIVGIAVAILLMILDRFGIF